MKTLIINAHMLPNPNSFSIKMQEHLVAKLKEKCSEFNILNLADAKIPRLDSEWMSAITKYSNGENLSEKENKIALKMAEILNQFKAHKRIVVVMPLHNFNVPSKFKDYMDNILIAGETFKYVTGGSVGLMTDDRKIMMLFSSGSIYTKNDRYTPMDFAPNYVKEMFVNIMGFNKFHLIRAEGTSVGAVDKAELLTNAFKQIDESLYEFLA